MFNYFALFYILHSNFEWVDIVRKVLEIQVKVILEVDVNMLLNKFILRDINAYKESLLL